jgi:hypothetical protein
MVAADQRRLEAVVRRYGGEKVGSARVKDCGVRLKSSAAVRGKNVRERFPKM